MLKTMYDATEYVVSSSFLSVNYLNKNTSLYI